jgi:hypothetical protein
MLLMIFYVLFFGVIDFIIYALFNQTLEIKPKLFIIYGCIFLFVIIIHNGLFDIKFLMPFRNLFNYILFSMLAIPFYYFGRYHINRIQKLDRISEDLKPRAYWGISFVFQKAPIVMIFIVQCMSVFAFIYM